MLLDFYKSINFIEKLIELNKIHIRELERQLKEPLSNIHKIKKELLKNKIIIEKKKKKINY